MKPNAGTGQNERIVKLLCFVLLFSVMNVTMFNIALPDIARDFHLRPSEASWVITGYAVMYAVGSLTYGKLADRYSLKNLLTVGLLLFVAGSLLGFFSHSYPLLLVARLVQSAGASSIPALVMLVPVRLFSENHRGRVLGVIASALAFAAGIGPIVGGFVSGTLHWRFLFLISVGTLAALPFLRKWLPEEERRNISFDLLGALLLCGTVISFMLSITLWNGLVLLAGILLLVLFSLRISFAKQPFIQPSFFRNAAYRSALFSGFLAFGTSFSIMFATPLMLASVGHMSATTVGLVMFPGAMSAALLGRLGGKWADQRGSVPVIYAAILLQMAGVLTLSTFSGRAAWAIAICLIFVNVGVSFYQISLAKLVATTLPAGQTGVGMGIFSLNNFMAGAVSGAAVSKIVDYSTSSLAFNPLALQGTASIYSNVYLGLFVIGLLNMGLVFTVFGKRQPKVWDAEQKSAL